MLPRRRAGPNRQHDLEVSDMKKSDAFPDKYLKAEHLKGKPVIVTITARTV